jgi:NADPH-dependent 2,4-dienoyl-CoA reductase/sulfur reductase-like enzyme
MLERRRVRVEARPVVGREGAGTELNGVRLADGEVAPARALFVPAPTRMAGPLAERLSCAMGEGPFGPVVCVDAVKQTKVTGVCAAGDAARVPHSIGWAVADGATAAWACTIRWLPRTPWPDEDVPSDRCRWTTRRREGGGAFRPVLSARPSPI